MFLCAPPRPYNPEQWPTIQQISNIVFSFGQPMTIQIIEDIIFILKSGSSLSEIILQYAQAHSLESWITAKGDRK